MLEDESNPHRSKPGAWDDLLLHLSCIITSGHHHLGHNQGLYVQLPRQTCGYPQSIAVACRLQAWRTEALLSGSRPPICKLADGFVRRHHGLLQPAF